jgi:hypothetical protein
MDNSSSIETLGRYIMLAGVAVTVVGVALWGLGKTGFRGLPGDMTYQSPRVTFYLPLGTCVLASAVLTGVFWLWRWLGRP